MQVSRTVLLSYASYSADACGKSVKLLAGVCRHFKRHSGPNRQQLPSPLHSTHDMAHITVHQGMHHQEDEVTMRLYDKADCIRQTVLACVYEAQHAKRHSSVISGLEAQHAQQPTATGSSYAKPLGYKHLLQICVLQVSLGYQDEHRESVYPRG